MHNHNIGFLQRTVRAALASALLIAATLWVTSQPWRTALVVAGLAVLVTAISGWCPAAAILGSTNSRPGGDTGSQ